MLMIRSFEEMITEIIAGTYAPLPRYTYVGPTHISIGQEAVSTGQSLPSQHVFSFDCQ